MPKTQKPRSVVWLSDISKVDDLYRIEVIRQGKWDYPGIEGGKFQISKADLHEFDKHFKEGAKGYVIPVNFDHKKNEVLGWGRKTEIAPNKEGSSSLYLYLSVEDPKRKEQVDNGTLKFGSAELNFKWRDPEDGKIKRVLEAFALTNVPYIKRLDPIKKVESTVDAVNLSEMCLSGSAASVHTASPVENMSVSFDQDDEEQDDSNADQGRDDDAADGDDDPTAGSIPEDEGGQDLPEVPGDDAEGNAAPDRTTSWDNAPEEDSRGEVDASECTDAVGDRDPGSDEAPEIVATALRSIAELLTAGPLPKGKSTHEVQLSEALDPSYYDIPRAAHIEPFQVPELLNLASGAMKKRKGRFVLPEEQEVARRELFAAIMNNPRLVQSNSRNDTLHHLLPQGIHPTGKEDLMPGADKATRWAGETAALVARSVHWNIMALDMFSAEITVPSEDENWMYHDQSCLDAVKRLVVCHCAVDPGIVCGLMTIKIQEPSEDPGGLFDMTDFSIGIVDRVGLLQTIPRAYGEWLDAYWGKIFFPDISAQIFGAGHGATYGLSQMLPDLQTANYAPAGARYAQWGMAVAAFCEEIADREIDWEYFEQPRAFQFFVEWFVGWATGQDSGMFSLIDAQAFVRLIAWKKSIDDQRVSRSELV